MSALHDVLKHAGHEFCAQAHIGGNFQAFAHIQSCCTDMCNAVLGTGAERHLLVPILAQDRGYVAKEGRALRPESRGRVLAAFLGAYFERYVDYGFTAGLEEQLDTVSGALLLPLVSMPLDGLSSSLSRRLQCILEPGNMG
jgi:hypothetical protein